MSRLEFRGEVADARPPSAWLLVSVAGATLWITEQLLPWTIALQALAIVYSLRTRSRPSAWQTSPITLNIGMFGIVGLTISLALEGNPATVSLAHFTALTSGLQLLDTRPRKSEFLLVALALFQVILAANLTDSVLFPPLLVIFLIAATWTLLVHTLRSEAIEAGNPVEATRAINSGLVRMTTIAALASVLLALVLFVMMPRMKSSMLKGSLGRGLPIAGFSDHVELGTIGRIRQDPTVVLRIETVEGDMPEREDAYWRGLAFDTFDGREWSISAVSGHRNRFHVPGTPRFGVELNGSSAKGVTLVQRVIRDPVEAGVVFSAGTPRFLNGPLDILEVDLNGGVYAPRQLGERVRYTVKSHYRARDDLDLDDDRASLPPDRAQPPGLEHGPERYLALPDLAPAVLDLAREWSAGAEGDAARAEALERALRRQGRYTDAPPDLGGEGEGSPVERFLLGELAGHCEYFASGMVVLARSLGLPARLVNGFAGGRRNKFGGFHELARSDAHTWVEIHFERAGWVRFDPTPPDLRLRGALAGSLGESLAELYSVIEVWWFQRVVDFDSADQVQAIKGLFAAWRSWRSTTSVDGEASPGGTSPGARSLELLRSRAWPVAAGLAGLMAVGVLWHRRRARSRPAAAVPRDYATALRLLSRRGLVRDPTVPARVFAREVGERLAPAAPAAARAFRDLTEDYLAERFGGRTRPGGDRLLATLRRGLGRTRRRDPEAGVDGAGAS